MQAEGLGEINGPKNRSFLDIAANENEHRNDQEISSVEEFRVEQE